MSNNKKISRRKFVIRSGLGAAGVLALGAYVLRNPIRRKILAEVNRMDPQYIGNTEDPMIWFELLESNQILLYSPKVEMGQGIFTGFAQMAADELDVQVRQIKVVNASTNSGNIDAFATGGSTSTASLWYPIRELAATFREMIKTEAAKKMELPIGALQTKDGVVYNKDKSMTYAEAMRGIKTWKIPQVPTLKPLSAYKYIGKPVPRVDLNEKVMGKPLFGMDAQLPNMVYGAVARPTKIGARLGSVITQKAEKMPGVLKIVLEEDFVGVVAKTYTQAEEAKKALEIDWEIEDSWDTESLENLVRVGNGTHTIIQKEGRALSDSEKGLEKLEFRSPIGAHAQLEPNGALVYVANGKATVILSTQVIGLTRSEVAKRLNFKEADVNVKATFLGGGFGRRLHTPHAVHAAVMSQQVGLPVKYYFTRQEEFQHDMFRSPTHHLLQGKLSEDGQLDALEHHFVSGDVGNNSAVLPKFVPTILGADVGAIRGGFLQYTGVPNHRAVYWHVNLPFATSWWRSLGLLANTFAIESFIDHMANKAGKNAVSFRLEMIQEDTAGVRLKNVIRTVAEKSGYTETSKNGRAMGFAVSVDSGTPCAQVVEVAVENKQIKVLKVSCAIDAGLIVNPDQVKAQCEGAICMGISASLYEQMFIENSELQPIIYGPYQMALMQHAPKEIDVLLVQGKETPGPVGEPPLGPVAVAIGNAVFRLTGKRLTNMPLKLI